MYLAILIKFELNCKNLVEKSMEWFDILGCSLHISTILMGVVGWCEGAVYLTSPGRPTDIGLQLGKACYPCSG